MQRFEQTHRLSPETSAVVGAIREVQGDEFTLAAIIAKAQIGSLPDWKQKAKVRTAVNYIAEADRVQWELVRKTGTYRKLGEVGKADRVEKKAGSIRRATRRTMREAGRVAIAALPADRRTQFIERVATLGTLNLMLTNDEAARVVNRIAQPAPADTAVLGLFARG